MTHRGPFQPLTFCDSVIFHFPLSEHGPSVPSTILPGTAELTPESATWRPEDVGERASDNWVLSTAPPPPQLTREDADGRLLTEALGDLPAPRAVPLAGQHGGQRELIALQAGIADAGAPAEIRAHDFPVGNGLWGFTDDS